MEFLRIKNPKVAGDVLVLAKRDFDPARHELAAAEATPDTAGPVADTAAVPPPADATTPPAASIATLTVEQAVPLIDSASLDAAQRMLTDEQARPTPRQGILKRIAARLAQLQG